MAEKKQKIGFIGLGLMGAPMAKNLIKNGYQLFIYNRSSSKTSSLKRLGAKVCRTPSEVGENSDIVITMITGPKDARKVLLGKDGVAEKLKSGGIVIDMSTIGPIAAKELAEDLSFCKIDFLDAPVTGSVPKAISGELTIFVGGNKATLDQAKLILEAIGKDIYYMGSSGSGQAIKMINNMIIAIGLVAVAEGMVLADKMGLSRKKVAQALENTPTLSPNMKMKIPYFITNKYPTAFSIANMDKDLKLALLEMRGCGSLKLLKKAENIYRRAIKKGLAEKDISAIFEVIKN